MNIFYIGHPNPEMNYNLLNLRMIIIVSVRCGKRLIVVNFSGMLQTVTSSAAVTIDVQDVVDRFGINEERAGTKV